MSEIIIFCAVSAVALAREILHIYFQKRTSRKFNMENMERMKKKSDTYYDKAWRWVEDTYLKYFGENRTSYGVKGMWLKGFLI
jgi:hypothetical protein